VYLTDFFYVSSEWYPAISIVASDDFVSYSWWYALPFLLSMISTKKKAYFEQGNVLIKGPFFLEVTLVERNSDPLMGSGSTTVYFML